MANPSTRTFYLQVMPDLMPFTQERRKGYTGIQMSDGTWFNTKKRSPSSKDVSLQYANEVSKYIEDIIKAEAKKLQTIWYQMVPKYFNRRAYGMYYKGVVSIMGDPSHRILHPWTNRRQYPGRNRTGQLRRALIIKSTTKSGCILYVKPCIAATGKNVDYVNILIHGASPKAGHPYIPGIDRRVREPNMVWYGISARYWRVWQEYFDKMVVEANLRLNARIAEYIEKAGLMEKADVQRALRASKAQKVITNLNETRQTRPSFTTVAPNTPYEKTRDLSGKGNYKKTPYIYKNKYGRFDPTAWV